MRPTGTFLYSQYTICCWSFPWTSLRGPQILKLKYGLLSGWTYRDQASTDWSGWRDNPEHSVASQARPCHSTEQPGEPSLLIKWITRTLNCWNISSLWSALLNVRTRLQLYYVFYDTELCLNCNPLIQTAPSPAAGWNIQKNQFASLQITILNYNNT